MLAETLVLRLVHVLGGMAWVGLTFTAGGAIAIIGVAMAVARYL